MDRSDWIKKIILSSVSLRQLNHVRKPVGFASGCLVDYLGKRMVLTVSHATGNDKNWSIEVDAIEGIAMKYHQIGAMMFLKRGNIADGSVHDVDFSYAAVLLISEPYPMLKNVWFLRRAKLFRRKLGTDFRKQIDFGYAMRRHGKRLLQV